MNPVFLNTGIPELNDLLTRRPDDGGIACPLKKGKLPAHPSSTMVIRAPAGTGKSVLCALLAHNLHLKLHAFPFGDGPTEINKYVRPFCVYFSFAQPAAGLYHYVDDILHGGLKKRPKQSAPLPLIISPKSAHGISETSGVETLRLCLLDLLNELSPHAYNTVSWKERVDAFVANLKKSAVWNLGVDGKPHTPDVVLNDVDVRPVVFLDPVNFLFERHDSRQAVARLFGTFRALQWPLIVALEDSGSETDAAFRLLSSYVEFESDVVVHLQTRSDPYFRRTIEIKKNRHSPARFGHHLFRIERPGHSLWNIPWRWKHKNNQWPSPHDPGFFIFPSIHHFLSQERDRLGVHYYSSTGITELDCQITGKNESDGQDVLERALPKDASILIRGEKGGHKLSLGFNFLVAGLWADPKLVDKSRSETEGPPPKNKTVLLISLGEETHNAVPRIALSRPNAEHRLAERTKVSDDDERTLAANSKPGYKVELGCWWKELPSSDSELATAETNSATPKLIEAAFKAGFLSAEEFLWIVESLVRHFQPCRVMIENTAHLHTRFPELAKEVMLFPAMSSLMRNLQIILIVTDVLGEGADHPLSRGLAAGADYIIDVTDFPENGGKSEWSDVVKYLEGPAKADLPTGLVPKNCTWAKLALSNVRGKDYRYERFAVTVYESSDETNRLFMTNVTSAISPFNRPKNKQSEPIAAT